MEAQAGADLCRAADIKNIFTFEPRQLDAETLLLCHQQQSVSVSPKHVNIHILCCQYVQYVGVYRWWRNVLIVYVSTVCRSGFIQEFRF